MCNRCTSLHHHRPRYWQYTQQLCTHAGWTWSRKRNYGTMIINMASKLGGHSLIHDSPLRKVGGSFDPPGPPSIAATDHSSPGVKVIRSTPQINVRFSKGGNKIELTSILGVFSSKFLFLAASHIATSALWHSWYFLLFLFLAVQARLLFGKRQISLLVSLAAQTAYATPGCGAHLHFTGLEPAVGLRPALWTLDHTSSTICRCLGRNFFKVLFPQSIVCIRYSLQLKAIHMGSVPGTTTFSSQSAIILDATLLLYVVFWFK